MHGSLLGIIAPLFAVLFAGMLAPVSRAADLVNPYNTTPHGGSPIQPGAAFEGEGEIWTPTQNARKSDGVKWHWKLTIKKVDGEKFTGHIEWVHNGTIHEKVEGTFVNGITLGMTFSGVDKGGSATGSIDNKGNVKFNYALPSADRVGEFTGTRTTPQK